MISIQTIKSSKSWSQKLLWQNFGHYATSTALWRCFVDYTESQILKVARIAILNFSRFIIIRAMGNKCLSIKLGWLMERRRKTISTLSKPGTRWHRRRAPDYRFPDFCFENFSLIFMGIFHCFAGTVSGEQWHRNVMHRGLGNWCIFWHIYVHCCREFSRNARARLFIDFQPPMAQRDVVKWHLKMHAKSSIGTSSCRYGWCNRIPSP